MTAYPVCKIFRITICLHWSILIPLVIGHLQLGEYAWVNLALFGIVLLHEFGHAAAARLCGMKCHAIVLFALGGMALIHGFHKRGTALNQLGIALAGPLVNLLLAPPLVLLAVWSQSAGVAFVAVANILMLAFNLLPVFPLDGGRCLHAVLWMMLGKQRGLVAAVRTSQALAVALGFVAAAYGMWFVAVIMGFAVLAAQQEMEARLAEDEASAAKLAARESSPDLEAADRRP